jgi:transcriptional regulator with XRE-family HTH domain
VDESEQVTDHRLVKLGQAIDHHLQGRPRRDLASALGITEGYLSKIANGNVPGLTLTMVARIEEALDVPAGTIFVAAGYVEDVTTPEAAVRSDGELPRLTKDVLLAASDAARQGRR